MNDFKTKEEFAQALLAEFEARKGNDEHKLFTDFNPRIETDASGKLRLSICPDGRQGAGLSLRMDDYFKDYQQAENWEEYVNKCFDTLKEQLEHMPDFLEKGPEGLLDPDNIFMYCVNAEKNQEMLSKVPHRIKDDLAVVYRIMVVDDGEKFATVLVDHDIAKHLGMDEQDLYERGISQTCDILTPEIIPVGEILFHDPDLAPEMMVLTTHGHKYSSGLILFKDLLDEAADRIDADKLIVFPSSMDEYLVTGTAGTKEDQQFALTTHRNIISSDPADIFLSSNVYIYDKDSRELTMVGGEEPTIDLNRDPNQE